MGISRGKYLVGLGSDGHGACRSGHHSSRSDAMAIDQDRFSAQIQEHSRICRTSGRKIDCAGVGARGFGVDADGDQSALRSPFLTFLPRNLERLTGMDSRLAFGRDALGGGRLFSADSWRSRNSRIRFNGEPWGCNGVWTIVIGNTFDASHLHSGRDGGFWC